MAISRWIRPLAAGSSALMRRTAERLRLTTAERGELAEQNGDFASQDAAAQHAVETVRTIHRFSATVLDQIEQHIGALDQLEELLESALDDGPTPSADSHSAVELQREFFEFLQRGCRGIQRDSLCIESYVTDALTDPLTLAANRRAFDFELQRRFSEWNRERRPISLIMVDIDHFKRINDLYGHQAGDELLRLFAELLSGYVRETDQVARYGGEEFGIILPNTSLEDAESLGRGVCHHIEENSFVVNQTSISLTASVGIATAVISDDQLSLVRRADMALYAAKRCGRNCVFKHDGLDCECVAHGTIRDRDETPSRRTPRDPVTDLHEAATFHEYLEYRIAEHMRYDNPFSLMSVRIGGFKDIQEHSASRTEAALRSVARFIRAALRSADFIARLEKDRFVAVLPATVLKDVLNPAERLRQSILEFECRDVDGEPLQMTLSIGAVEVSDSCSAMQLLARVDEATDAAAAAGGNRIYGQDQGICLDLDALSLLGEDVEV